MVLLGIMRILRNTLPLLLFMALLPLERGLAQSFIGTNAPGQGTNFSFTTGAGATNLSPEPATAVEVGREQPAISTQCARPKNSGTMRFANRLPVVGQ